MQIINYNSKNYVLASVMLNGSQKLRFDERKYLLLKFNQPKLHKLLSTYRFWI